MPHHAWQGDGAPPSQLPTHPDAYGSWAHMPVDAQPLEPDIVLELRAKRLTAESAIAAHHFALCAATFRALLKQHRSLVEACDRDMETLSGAKNKRGIDSSLLA